MSPSPVNNAEYGGNVPRIGRPDNRSGASNAKNRAFFPDRPVSPYRRGRDDRTFASAESNHKRYLGARP
jgi:hypothetical protein